MEKFDRNKEIFDKVILNGITVTQIAKDYNVSPSRAAQVVYAHASRHFGKEIREIKYSDIRGMRENSEMFRGK